MTDEDELKLITEHILTTRGLDLDGYKRSSLLRRLRKRGAELGLADLGAYRAYLQNHVDEATLLFDTLLINVTSFFRDPDTWQLVADVALPQLLGSKPSHEPVRVWVAGCATGEEAYTIAMLLCEAMGDEAYRARARLYATDIDDAALDVARAGRYPTKAVEAHVPPERAARFFEAAPGTGIFRKDLRRTLVFGRHDLTRDPPISRIDFLACRNTLMYFVAEPQRRVLERFHFALVPSGFLLLGRSEALATRTEQFTPFDLRHRLYTPAPTARARLGRRNRDQEGPKLDDPRDVRLAGFEGSPVPQLVIDRTGALGAANALARKLLGLSPSDIGRPLQDLEISYRPVELRSRLETVAAERRPLVVPSVQWPAGDDGAWFDVVIKPLASDHDDVAEVLVAFADVSRQHGLEEELGRSRIELQTALEELQSAVEALETTNEELQSTNEELETTNEELQSTNEELETTNEELQSTNEELQTTNEQLRDRTDELDATNAFLEAILASLSSGVIVLDREMRVQVWNRLAEDQWGLRTGEVVRQHLMNLDVGLPLNQLHQPVRACLLEGQEHELNITAINRRGRAVNCRVRVAPLRRNAQVVGAILLVDNLPAEVG